MRRPLAVGFLHVEGCDALPEANAVLGASGSAPLCKNDDLVDL